MPALAASLGIFLKLSYEIEFYSILAINNMLE